MYNNEEYFEYAGFWRRFGAVIIDSVVIMLATMPMLYLVYGEAYFTSEPEGMFHGSLDVLISIVLPFLVYIWLWTKYGTSPGKKALNIYIIDRDTGINLSVGASSIRYLGYIVSTLPLGLGFLWVAWDSKKQGWHDKMAGSVVVVKEPEQYYQGH